MRRRLAVFGVVVFGAGMTALELSRPDAFLALERFERWQRDDPALHLLATEQGSSEPDGTWLSALDDGAAP